jgi:hypothetical protein
MARSKVDINGSSTTLGGASTRAMMASLREHRVNRTPHGGVEL